MFTAILGFPGSGQKAMSEVLKALELHGTADWKAMLPENKPHKMVSSKRKTHGGGADYNRIVHLMRYPWHAISAALALPKEDLVQVRDAAGIHAKAPACHLDTEVSRIKVLTLAFPKWYDMIRELNPEMMLKLETFESQLPKLQELVATCKDPGSSVFMLPKIAAEAKITDTVTYEEAVKYAGELAANAVEVIARNLYKHIPLL